MIMLCDKVCAGYLSVMCDLACVGCCSVLCDIVCVGSWRNDGLKFWWKSELAFGSDDIVFPFVDGLPSEFYV